MTTTEAGPGDRKLKLDYELLARESHGDALGVVRPNIKDHHLIVHLYALTEDFRPRKMLLPPGSLRWASTKLKPLWSTKDLLVHIQSTRWGGSVGVEASQCTLGDDGELLIGLRAFSVEAKYIEHGSPIALMTFSFALELQDGRRG